MDAAQGNIWDRFTRGDAKSLEQIYTSHYDMLLQYGFKFTTDLSLIEESVQTLFIKMWNNRSSLNEPVSLKYYLLKAFRRILTRRLQQQSRFNSRITGFEAIGFHLRASEEDKLVDREEQERKKAFLEKIIDTLTNRQKEAIYLRFFEELSYEEISTILGIDVGATYKLIYRAIDRLKENKHL